MTSSDKELIRKQDGHLLSLIINREQRRNSLTGDLVVELTQALISADEDPNIRVICLTGVGDKAFCSGADLSSEPSSVNPADTAKAYAELLVCASELGTPLLARVNGHCVAGGIGLLLSCDLAIACDDVSFATPEVRSGLFPVMIAPLIVKHVGPKKALEMILCAKRYSAAEALEMGFINRVVARWDLDSAIDQLVADLLAGGPAAISIGKRALNKYADLPIAQTQDQLSRELVKILGTQDAAEGISAFLQKRKPAWKGK
jgi:enoyl-CoA hydratase/carnithine racemase